MVLNGVDITPIITSLLEVILGALVVWFSTKAIPWIKGKLTSEQLDLVKDFVKICVRAAEQIYPAEEATKKLEYVMQLVEDWLSAHGIELDLDTVRAMIEAAVLEMKKELYPDELATKRADQLAAAAKKVEKAAKVEKVAKPVKAEKVAKTEKAAKPAKTPKAPKSENKAA